jgi:hypothetical protein
MSFIVYPLGVATVAVAAGQSIALQSQGEVTVTRNAGFPNHPDQQLFVGFLNNGVATFGPFAAATSLRIETQAANVLYEIGVAPVVQSVYNGRPQPSPVAVDVTGAVSALAINNGLVTSTTAAAVAGTVPTGTVMEQSSNFAINDAIDWSVINTGATNAFTVTAATAHTLVGNAVVALSSTGRFRTRKTALNTFVTYRLG